MSRILPKENSRNEPELRHYVAAFKRRSMWLLGSIAVGAILGLLLTFLLPLTFESTAKVLLSKTPAQNAVEEFSLGEERRARDLLNEIDVAYGDDVTDLVRQRLNIPAEDKLPEGSIEANPESDVLSFTFEGRTAQEAADIANTWANTYVELKQLEAETSIAEAVERLQARQNTLREQRAEIRANLETLEDRLARADPTQAATLGLQVDREASAISGDLNLVDAQIESNIASITQLQLSGELASVGTAEVLQKAPPPRDPKNGSLSRNLAVGLLLGTLTGIGLALLVDNLDHSITDAEDIQRMGLTLLGAIPEASRKQVRGGLAMIAQTQPGTPMADGYQKIRTALQFTTLGKDVKTILVTSPEQGDGKTTTAANLALALANVESRVVLADIDFRRPQIHTIFNTALIPGMSDALLGQTTLRDVVVNHPELSTTLVAMPAGTQPPNPATFLVSSRFAGLLSDLRNQADLTILDAPPVLPVADALSIASHADGVIMVVKAGSTTHGDLTAAVESIIRSGGRLLGVVVNHASSKAMSYGKIGGMAAAAQADSVGRFSVNSDRQLVAHTGGQSNVGQGAPMSTVSGDQQRAATQPSAQRQSTAAATSATPRTQAATSPVTPAATPAVTPAKPAKSVTPGGPNSGSVTPSNTNGSNGAANNS